MLSADMAAIYRQTDLARQMLADEARGALPDGIVSLGKPAAQELLRFGANGGDQRSCRWLWNGSTGLETTPR